MVIKVIRHGKVDFDWKDRYDSEGFDRANIGYDESPIKVIEKRIDPQDELIFVSDLERTTDTANYLFDNRGNYIRTELLNEVPARSYKDTDKLKSLHVWKPMSRIQWFFNNKRQFETRSQSMARALEAIDFIETYDQDAYVVCHAIFMKVLVRAFRKKGYKVSGNRPFFFKNLDQFTAKK